MFKYLFGPIPSRRLGLSLGIDLVPQKVCSLDCIYCEVGLTSKLSLERKEYIPFSKIKSELEAWFESEADPEYFTFSGYGEPTLNSAIGKVISYIKSKKPQIPIAVLTNATLFTDPEVRHELLDADLILPSIDAASDEVFHSINRPVDGLSAKKHIEGLVEFRKEFSGTIWLEIMIIPGINDQLDELINLKKAIMRIQPDKIQLNSLDRPGTVDTIRPATGSELEQITKLWNLPNVEIISKAANQKHVKSTARDLEKAILETIVRRPCTIDDLHQSLNIPLEELAICLSSLENRNNIAIKWGSRGLFYYVPDSKAL
jgi:wyosine [tRNA(Phe)-imidazoG37] synthetase (radical SAM superfamily)